MVSTPAPRIRSEVFRNLNEPVRRKRHKTRKKKSMPWPRSDVRGALRPMDYCPPLSPGPPARVNPTPCSHNSASLISRYSTFIFKPPWICSPSGAGPKNFSSVYCEAGWPLIHTVNVVPRASTRK